MSDLVTIGSNGAKSEKNELKENVLKEEIKQLRRQFRTQLRQVEEQLNKGKSLDDMENEIHQKKSTLPANARDFVLMFNPDFIMDMLNFKEK